MGLSCDRRSNIWSQRCVKRKQSATGYAKEKKTSLNTLHSCEVGSLSSGGGKPDNPGCVDRADREKAKNQKGREARLFPEDPPEESLGAKEEGPLSKPAAAAIHKGPKRNNRKTTLLQSILTFRHKKTSDCSREIQTNPPKRKPSLKK